MPATRRALLSVSDKSGLLELARGLSERGFEIVSTGGTAQHLEANGLEVTTVAKVTGSPQILDGRVKTLHPKIHGGILADRAKTSHLEELRTQGIAPIDLVVVNLYPFRETLSKAESTPADIVEMIDIGGPTMVRAAAKNHAGVTIVVDPADYADLLATLDSGDDGALATLRRRLAAKAFRHTADYDAAIAAWFETVIDAQAAAPVDRPSPFPAALHLELELTMTPRYGENPHQRSAVYRDLRGPGVLGGMRQLQGKELSWNNLLDADAARKLVALFAEPAVVIVKHNNPCGVGRGSTLAEAYARAFASDPVSAFGSIVALNRPADRAFADAMADLFVEVLVAPEVEPAALEKISAKKMLRVLTCPRYQPVTGEFELRAVDGGFLAQDPDAFTDDESGWTCPTRRQPTAEQRRALSFAWRVSRYVKSNAIVLTNGDQTVGVGAGQMSRVDSCRLAIQKAQLPVAGTVAASDAFFPFRDGLDVLADAGVAAIAHPGGSKRDDEVIAAADERDVALVVTGTRHFRH